MVEPSRSSGSAETTQSVPVFGTSTQGRTPQSAGLVLLYAHYYEQFQPAYLLGEGNLIIGRDSSASIRVPGRAVSRLHARIDERGESWVLTDLQGRNGTLVNGKFVREVTLQHLNEIRVGDAIFKFVERDAGHYARYRIDGTRVGGASGAARSSPPSGAIVGGYQIEAILTALRQIAPSNLSVLILGESGTGKEVFAQELHRSSGRRGSFQAINCAAIPAALLEGELFGWRRGAFSGADRDRPGIIRAAHEGTLFLDEIGDMPLEAQAKLLRVLQTKEVTPLGATAPERIDVRFVCATHRDIQTLQQSGGFRGDLYARLNEYSLTLPPLRERKEDIFSLCLGLSARHGRPRVDVTFRFMTALLHYDFPFNIRELEALMKRWAAMTSGSELDVQHLTDAIQERMKTYGGPNEPAAEASPPEPAERAKGAPERGDPSQSPPRLPDASPSPAQTFAAGGVPSEQELRDMLAQHHGNVAAVARLLSKDRVQIHRWMKRYEIEIEEYR
jgi:DNA-binding NtrC family response regulator